MKRIVLLAIMLVVLFSFQPAVIATASVGSFDIAKAEQDGFSVSTNSNTGSTFISYSDDFPLFNTPYDAPGHNDRIETDIIILANNGKARMRTWFCFSTSEPICIESVSFLIGQNEYEFSGLVCQDTNRGEYWDEAVCIRYGSDNIEFIKALDAAYRNYTVDELLSMTIPVTFRNKNTTFNAKVEAYVTADILRFYDAMNAYGGTFENNDTLMTIHAAAPTTTPKPIPAPTPIPSD